VAKNGSAPAAWKSRIVGEGEEPPGELILNPGNWRTHPTAQTKALAGALDEVGWVQRVIVNKRTGHLVDGHARVELAVERGEAAVPVVYVDLDEDEERVVLAALDPLAAMAGTDQAKLDELLASLRVNDEALRAMLEGQRSTRPGLTEPDAVPQDVPPVTKPGDLWLLGEHRLLCGDATRAEDVGRLMAGDQIGAVVTDPPYGVGYEYESWDDDDPAINDSLFEHIEALGRPTVYFCGSVNLLRELERGPAKVLIWHKPWSMTHSGIGNGRHHWEPVIVRRLEKGSYIPSDVLVENTDRIPGLRGEHSCPKPVALLATLIGALTFGVVHDPFVGSGTTIIACERQGRTCYAMDIDAHYTDVSVRRWEEYTGKKAKLERAKANTNKAPRARPQPRQAAVASTRG
jgi:hypothetical protein